MIFQRRPGYLEKQLPCGCYREWPEEYGEDYEPPENYGDWNLRECKWCGA